ncbi:hypothetical protein PN462_08730 [Spirulina sp. CS-785/01]|uniref:hypothetical protein n=1 Tax=Spirulina sp. CS-785/01 TaxID=3021716 RepID=UPI00232E9447|nr:hypothetical protein [Spirulina sp. CS-785/01]MDB9313183.1 hypothetical protein [Spirulina sp. CS-785/01]
MIPCPCCSQRMLMFAQKGRTYWYCPNCRQEMPDLLNVMMTAQHERSHLNGLRSKLVTEEITVS